MRNAAAQAEGRNYLWYFFGMPMYNVIRAEEAEEIFQNPRLITKNVIYDLLRPFLGEGLLTSTGGSILLMNYTLYIKVLIANIDQKWHARRKALTPAFHFNVLQSFLTIFK